MATRAYLLPGYGEDRDMCRLFGDSLAEAVPAIESVEIADFYNRTLRREVELKGTEAASVTMARLALEQFGTMPSEYDLITHSYGDMVAQSLADEGLRYAIRMAPAGIVKESYKIVPRFTRNILDLLRNEKTRPFGLNQARNILLHSGAYDEALEMCRAEGYLDDLDKDAVARQARQSLILTFGKDVVFHSAWQAHYGHKQLRTVADWVLDASHSGPFIDPAKTVAKIQNFYAKAA